jgi:hypothetical protein
MKKICADLRKEPCNTGAGAVDYIYRNAYLRIRRCAVKLILKILAVIVFVPFHIIYGICKAAFYVSGTVLAILSVLVAILGVAVLIFVSPLGGIAWLFIAFLISPFGLTKLAALVVAVLAVAGMKLRAFIVS